MAFWDAKRGVAVSDSVDGQFVILTTTDGGNVVGARAGGSAPAGAAERRVLRGERHERHRGRAEPRLGRHRRRERSARPALERRRPHVGRCRRRRSTPARLPESSRSPSATRRTASWSAATTRPSRPSSDNAALTTDGGATWTPSKASAAFARSSPTVLATRRRLSPSVRPARTCRPIAAGHGRRLPGPGFHAFSFARSGGVGFGVGEKGSAGRLNR